MDRIGLAQSTRTLEPIGRNGRRFWWWYGFALLGMAAGTVGSANADSGPGGISTHIHTDRTTVGQMDMETLPKIRTANMNINYHIFTANGQTPMRVELWYARGWGAALQLYDYDTDCVSPIPFIAQGEGVYRFLVVAVDRWGQRSYNEAGSLQAGAVSPEIPSQQVVLVDYTPPRLYLQYPRANIPEYRDRRLPIRWVGFDSHLDARPVKLYCQRQGSEHWVEISGPQPARNEFIWEIPERVNGPVIIKAVITDRAGNQQEQTSGVIQIRKDFSMTDYGDPTISVEALTPVYKKTRTDLNQYNGNISNDGSFTRMDRQENAKLYFHRGNVYSQRLEWEQAARAFRKVLEYDPKSVSARVNLANALFRMGQFQQAQAEYSRCLQENQHQESALFGLAQTQIRLQQYEKAQKTLANLLQQDRQDWQAWLMHGNVSAQLGHQDAAVSSWQQACHDMSPVRKLAMDQLLKINQDPSR